MSSAVANPVASLAVALRGVLGVANVEPGGRFPRKERRFMERYTQLLSLINGDPMPPATAPQPSEFDARTMEWCLRPSRLIVVWTAGIDAPPTFWETVTKALEKPPGRACLVLTRPELEKPWLEVVNRFMPAGGHVLLLRPGVSNG